MSWNLKNIVSIGNGGDGMRVEGNDLPNIDGYLAMRNGGHGLNIVQKATLLQALGLPESLDPKALGLLLQALQDSPQAERESKVRESGVLAALDKVADVSVVVSKILEVAQSPAIVSIVSQLLN